MTITSGSVGHDPFILGQEPVFAIVLVVAWVADRLFTPAIGTGVVLAPGDGLQRHGLRWMVFDQKYLQACQTMSHASLFP